MTNYRYLHGTWRFLAYSSTLPRNQREMFDFSPDSRIGDILVYSPGTLPERDEYYFLAEATLDDDKQSVDACELWRISLKEPSLSRWQVEPLDSTLDLPDKLYNHIYEDMYASYVSAVEDSIDYADIDIAREDARDY